MSLATPVYGFACICILTVSTEGSRAKAILPSKGHLATTGGVLGCMANAEGHWHLLGKGQGRC